MEKPSKKKKKHTDSKEPRKSKKKAKKASQRLHSSLSHSAAGLAKDVARSRILEPEELLSLFDQYEESIMQKAFLETILPHSRFGRRYIWLQVHNVLSSTDHGRTILRSVVRSSNEDEFSLLSKQARARWSKHVKPNYSFSLTSAIGLLKKLESGKTISFEELKDVGIARLVYEYAVSDFLQHTSGYLKLSEENVRARLAGDPYLLATTDSAMRAIERRVGCSRDKLWFVVVNARKHYSDVQKIHDTLANSYSRLLMKMANRFKGKTSVEENFSAGAQGLLQAAANYDAEVGAAFATYSQWWIRNAILYNQKISSVVKIPHTTWYALSQVDKEIAKNGTHKGKFTDSYVENLRKRANMHHTVSLDAPLDDGHNEQTMTAIESLRVLNVSADTYGDLIADTVPDEEYEQTHETITALDTLEKGLKVLDETSVFPVTAWMLNNGMDSNLVARLFAKTMIDKEEVIAERTRQQRARESK